MNIIRVILNFIARVIGIGLLCYSFYYGVNHEISQTRAGIVHIPSLILVLMGMTGIVLASYQVELIAKMAWNSLFFSPTSVRRRLEYMEEILPELTDTYYKDGAVGLLEKVEKLKLSSLWQYIANKLEAHLPIHDIQMMIQHEGREYNEALFTQIRALQGLATVAPAVGMTGTILGLIKLLKDLQNFQALGSNMALAFITALYGLVIGNFVFIPMTNRLNAAREESMQLLSQATFWLEMVSQRKPSDYLDAEDREKITA